MRIAVVVIAIIAELIWKISDERKGNFPGRICCEDFVARAYPTFIVVHVLQKHFALSFPLPRT